MSEQEILKAVETCISNSPYCGSCPLKNCDVKCGVYLAKYIHQHIKKEPAPEATGTSTKIKTLHDNDIIRFQICQESARKMLKLKEEFEVAGYEQSKNLTVLMAARGLTISNLLLEIGGE